jgi:uroporphyrinogen III methyltransferase / synthase
MQPAVPTITSLTGRTILISPSDAHGRELATELERHGARVLTWPRLDIGPVENHAALDEAIENIFGYDWLVLRNVSAANYFLRRFQELGRDISELDSLRVCAIGAATVARLEESQVHVDVIPDQLSSEATFSALEAYVGGRDSLRGLNFLIPRAAIASDSLTCSLEDAGARVDEVTTYRTCAANNPDLAQIKGLLTGGGIDCIAFASSSEVREFSEVFDSNDLFRLLEGVAVVGIDESTAQAAADFALRVDFAGKESTSSALARSVSEYLA